MFTYFIILLTVLFFMAWHSACKSYISNLNRREDDDEDN